MPNVPLAAPESKPIRVVIIDASPLITAALTRMIESDQTLICVGSASNGRAGLEKITRARPDAICCATQLPIVSGVELVRAVMSQFPTPILALQPGDDASNSAPAIGADAAAMLAEGAVDWMVKPASQPAQIAAFLTRIARIARVRALTRHRAHVDASALKSVAAPAKSSAPITISAPVAPTISAKERGTTGARPELIAIGASTGGPPVLLQLLRALAPTSAPPVLCVQHIASGFLDEMVSWLRAQCRVEIVIARGGEVARRGTVYFPAEDRHLEIGGNGRLRLSDALPRAGHRPAVDVTFEAVARSYGARALAILLTGMGADGAAGLHQIKSAGGTTWAQTPASCVVAGMPGKAIELGAANSVFTPDEMVARLQRLE